MNYQTFKKTIFCDKIKKIYIRQNNPISKKDYHLIELGLKNTHRLLTYNGYFKRNNQIEFNEYIKAINY